MKKLSVILLGLIATSVVLSSCYAPGYVYQQGKKKKVKRSEVKVIHSKKAGGDRPCSDEW